jgi:hypothetical protein
VAIKDDLTEANFLLFAAKNYLNTQCFDTTEFYDDLKRLKYLKRLFNRYEESGELKERLILNHITVLYNVFGLAATRMLFLKLPNHFHLLKPFLVLLNYMPEKIKSVGGQDIQSSDILMDAHIVEVLRRI